MTRLVVFDWDGTIADSRHRITSAMQAAFQVQQLPAPNEADIAHYIGLPVSHMIAHLSPRLSSAQVNAVVGEYAAQFRARAAQPVTPFADVINALRSLHQQGYWLAVATGKSRRGLDRELSELAIEDIFLATRTADESRPKPNPHMLLELIDVTGVDAESSLMVGDTSFDMSMAANAAVRGVGVTWGSHSAEMLANAGAVAIVDRVHAVTDAVSRLLPLE